MDQQRPWSRWLFNLVLPGRYNDTFALGSAQVVLTENESKLLAKYAVAADHLVGPPPAPNAAAPHTSIPLSASTSASTSATTSSGWDSSSSTTQSSPRSPVPPRAATPGNWGFGLDYTPPSQVANPTPVTLTDSMRLGRNNARAGLGMGPAPAPPRPPGNVGLGVVGVAVSGGTWGAVSRTPLSGTVGGGDDAPAAPPIQPSTKRRPKVLNKLSLGSMSPMLDSPTPSTPGRPELLSPPPVSRYPQNKARPAMVTMERAAACALYFEQYYDALSRKNGPAIGGGRQRRNRASAATFEFGRVIGQGAFGVVRIAREKENGRIVAIKQLRKVDLLRMGQEGHIRAEKDLLSAASTHMLGPSWIPRLYYSFQDQDHLYFALEFMGGGDLLTLLVSRGSLPETTVRFYAAEMILALHQTHKLGYIHRDVKPDNFLFTSEGHIRVADFGLATDLHWAHDSAYYEHQRRALLKRHGVPLERPAFGNRRRNVEGMQGGGVGWGDKGKNLLTWRSRNRRRQAYTICGTNSYMAPEVIRGNGYGFGVDWWGLGVIVYEAIYGTIPFIGNSREHARKKILDWRNQLHFPRRGVSPLALDFMKKLLCDPEDRLGYVSTGRRGSTAGLMGSSAPAPVPSTSVGNGTVTILDGPLGHDGVEQLMAHPWFNDIDWSKLHEVYPPFQPSLRAVDDTRHFDDDIPDEPLAPGNSALYLRDPLLGDKVCGKEALAIRKELAFKGWTFRSKIVDEGTRQPPLGMRSTSATSTVPDRTAYSPSPHRARQDASATLRAPVHEATMMSMASPTVPGTDETDSDFSDDSDMETEVGWNTDDIDVDGDAVDAPEPETPEIEMEDEDNAIADVVDSYLDQPEHQYGYARHPRRLYPRGYEVYPRYQPHTNSFERAYDDHWWETQQLDLREMLALGDPEDYERPSCVPAATSASPKSSVIGSPKPAQSTVVAGSPGSPVLPAALNGAPVTRSKTKLVPRTKDKDDEPASPNSATTAKNRERARSMPPVNLVSLRA